jgi:hypothetical protein
VWGGTYLLLKSVTFVSSLPSPGLILLLIAWLVLLRFAILPDQSADDQVLLDDE